MELRILDFCSGVDDERLGRCSAQGSSPCAQRQRGRQRPNVRAPRDHQHLRGGPQGQGRPVVCEMMNITDAKKVKAMHISVGCFSSPSCALIYQCSKVCHRREVSAVARCGAPRQGGGVVWQRGAGLRRGHVGNLRLSRLCLFHRCGRHRALLAAPAACAPTLRRKLTLAPRLEGSCATRFSPTLAPRASWRQCARWGEGHRAGTPNSSRHGAHPRASGRGFARRAPAVCDLHYDGRCDAQLRG
eukprot:1553862-Pleurochrysis_carterae.AAC.1